jgi:hypothetical protein
MFDVSSRELGCKPESVIRVHSSGVFLELGVAHGGDSGHRRDAEITVATSLAGQLKKKPGWAILRIIGGLSIAIIVLFATRCYFVRELQTVVADLGAVFASGVAFCFFFSKVSAAARANSSRPNKEPSRHQGVHVFRVPCLAGSGLLS